MRLFIAIRFSEEIHRELFSVRDALHAQARSGNFTRPENLHLTLAFLGETNETQKIRQVMDAVPASPFPLTVGGTGRFGDTWWVGVDKSTALERLADGLRSGLLNAGFSVDTKPFRPHITIVRQLAADAPVTLSAPRTQMTVDRVSLMKSERVNGKLSYTELYGRLL